jgi:hypothetical protein
MGYAVMQGLSHIASVSTEAGPLVILDRVGLPHWTGFGGGNYDDLCAWLDNHPESVGVTVTIKGNIGFGWDIGGAGTADIYRADNGDILLYRAWAEVGETGRPDPPVLTGEVDVGELVVTTGEVVVFWSAENGAEVEIPLGAQDGVELEVAGIAWAGALVHMRIGEYRILGGNEANQRWCWLKQRYSNAM